MEALFRDIHNWNLRDILIIIIYVHVMFYIFYLLVRYAVHILGKFQTMQWTPLHCHKQYFNNCLKLLKCYERYYVSVFCVLLILPIKGALQFTKHVDARL